MLCRVAMTTIARDGFLGKCGGVVLVESAGDGSRLAGVAEQAFQGHDAHKIRGAILLVPWRHIVALESGVVTNGRLEQVIANADKVPGGVFTGSDYVVDSIFRHLAVTLHTLPKPRCVGIDREPRAGEGMFERSLGFFGWPSQGV